MHCTTCMQPLQVLILSEKVCVGGVSAGNVGGRDCFLLGPYELSLFS